NRSVTWVSRSLRRVKQPVFVVHDVVHEQPWIVTRIGQWPAKAHGCGQLNSRLVVLSVAPEFDELPDRTAAATQTLDFLASLLVGYTGVGEALGPGGQPLDQHASLRVTQASCQGLILKNEVQQRSRPHAGFSPGRRTAAFCGNSCLLWEGRRIAWRDIGG